MASNTAEDLYEAIKQLPVSERLRLVARIERDLAVSPAAAERFDWTQLAGVAPRLLEGEDAQTWVSRSRCESDDHRSPSRKLGT